MVRAAASALLVRGEKFVVRGPLRTRTVDRSEVESFSLGRYKILGCVCLLHQKNGADDVAVFFAIQGITGQPNRHAGIGAREVVAELNARLVDS
jgi:hypothetical protein